MSSSYHRDQTATVHLDATKLYSNSQHSRKCHNPIVMGIQCYRLCSDQDFLLKHLFTCVYTKLKSPVGVHVCPAISTVVASRLRVQQFGGLNTEQAMKSNPEINNEKTEMKHKYILLPVGLTVCQNSSCAKLSTKH